MVWSQYVYEATTGFEPTQGSDDEDFNDEVPLNIEDWEVQYSEELWYMWGRLRQLMYDCSIEHDDYFDEFVEFCYREHDPYMGRVTWESEDKTKWFEDRLHYVWKCLRRVINNNHLNEEMMRGATFYHFVDFAKNYINVY